MMGPCQSVPCMYLEYRQGATKNMLLSDTCIDVDITIQLEGTQDSDSQMRLVWHECIWIGWRSKGKRAKERHYQSWPNE